MNYLAHIYLSQGRKLVEIGNFAADSIKGKDFSRFPLEMQKGILLHRKIDYYTDSHPIVYKSAHRLFDEFRHYSTVIIDIFYDHFLAKNWKNYSAIPLEAYVQEFYSSLKKNHDILPKRVQRFYPIMIEYNWLLSYAKIEGIEHILFQMNNRVKGRTQLDKSVNSLRENYAKYEEEFTAFFEELQAFSKEEFYQIDIGTV